MALVTEVYQITLRLPPQEQYGLSAQLRRAAVSVPSNIAEGAARGGAAEYARFCRISLGSLAEMETQLLIAQQLGYIDEIPAGLIIDVRRALHGLERHLASSRQR